MRLSLRRAGVAALALAQLTVVGCASYQRVDPRSAPAPGTSVRVDLSDAGVAANAAQLGARTESVQGVLLAADSSGVSLAVTDVTRFNGRDEPVAIDSLKIASSDVSQLAVRRISRARSAVLAAAVIAAVAVIRASVHGTDEPGGRGTGGQTGQQ